MPFTQTLQGVCKSQRRRMLDRKRGSRLPLSVRHPAPLKFADTFQCLTKWQPTEQPTLRAWLASQSRCSTKKGIIRNITAASSADARNANGCRSQPTRIYAKHAPTMHAPHHYLVDEGKVRSSICSAITCHLKILALNFLQGLSDTHH